MKIIKSNLKVIISFIIGVIIASSITVYATSYFAKDITYKDGKNVEQALNDLYEKSKQNLAYDIIAQKDSSSTSTYSYTIVNDDLKYKSIILIVESGNVSATYSPATITISNQNIITIYDPSELAWTDYGYNVTSDMYVGIINNPIKDDVIGVSSSWGSRILLLGVK